MARKDEKDYACMCVPLGENLYTKKRPTSESDRDAKVMRMLVHKTKNKEFIAALIEAGQCKGSQC